MSLSLGPPAPFASSGGPGRTIFPSDSCGRGQRPESTRTKADLPVAFLPVTISELPGRILQLRPTAIASPLGVTTSASCVESNLVVLLLCLHSGTLSHPVLGLTCLDLIQYLLELRDTLYPPRNVMQPV